MSRQPNKVELIGIYGDDLTHGLSAWTSTSRDLTEEKRNRVDKLLDLLAPSGHETPFEKSMIHFLVTVETASHIHILKHRIGVSVNGESARYKELKEDKYLVPDDWNEEEQEALLKHMEESLDKYHKCLNRLIASGMSRKRAKESARFYLPYANQVTLDVSFNFRSFVHFLNLRNKPDAQVEIQQIAQKMLDLVIESGKFPLSLKAFGLVEDKHDPVADSYDSGMGFVGVKASDLISEFHETRKDLEEKLRKAGVSNAKIKKALYSKGE